MTGMLLDAPAAVAAAAFGGWYLWPAMDAECVAGLPSLLLTMALSMAGAWLCEAACERSGGPAHYLDCSVPALLLSACVPTGVVLLAGRLAEARDGG